MVVCCVFTFYFIFCVSRRVNNVSNMTDGTGTYWLLLFCAVYKYCYLLTVLASKIQRRGNSTPFHESQLVIFSAFCFIQCSDTVGLERGKTSCSTYPELFCSRTDGGLRGTREWQTRVFPWGSAIRRAVVVLADTFAIFCMWELWFVNIYIL